MSARALHFYRDKELWLKVTPGPDHSGVIVFTLADGSTRTLDRHQAGLLQRFIEEHSP